VPLGHASLGSLAWSVLVAAPGHAQCRELSDDTVVRWPAGQRTAREQQVIVCDQPVDPVRQSASSHSRWPGRPIPRFGFGRRFTGRCRWPALLPVPRQLPGFGVARERPRAGGGKPHADLVVAPVVDRVDRADHAGWLTPERRWPPHRGLGQRPWSSPSAPLRACSAEGLALSTQTWTWWLRRCGSMPLATSRGRPGSRNHPTVHQSHNRCQSPISLRGSAERGTAVKFGLGRRSCLRGRRAVAAFTGTRSRSTSERRANRQRSGTANKEPGCTPRRSRQI